MSAAKRLGARSRAHTRVDDRTAYVYDPEAANYDDAASKYGKRRRFSRHGFANCHQFLNTLRALFAPISRVNVARLCGLFIVVVIFARVASNSSETASKARVNTELDLGLMRVEPRKPPGAAAAPNVMKPHATSADDVRRANGGYTSGTPQNKAKLIPRIVHQTFKSRGTLTEKDKAFMQTWRTRNPDWEIRFYDDEDCARFVQEHFPDYYDAYAALVKKVEQSDFFRYLVILKHGGVYADIDTECQKPLDDMIDAKDTLIVGWENEFDSDAKAYSRHFVRRRQVLNWAFAGAPGHPALLAVAEHINSGAKRVFTKASNRNTLERTGPGAFTDAIMSHFEGLRTTGKTFWNIRVLPKVVLGTHPLGEEGVSQNHPDVVIAHRYSGGWKDKTGWNGKRHWYNHIAILWHSIMNDLPAYREQLASRDEHFQMPLVDSKRQYPVTALWEPAFDLMTPLVGTIEENSASSKNEDRNAEGYWLTLYGRPKVVTHSPLRAGQNPAEILFAGLERHAGEHIPERAVFIDIGAGLGYYSNAAASRGDDVYSYEWDETLLANFKTSVEYNGFGDHVKISADLDRLTNGEAFKDMIDAVGKIDAMRIAARGREMDILGGFKMLLAAGKYPMVLLLEMRPALIEASTKDIIAMFDFLWSNGYTDIGHVGPACDGRGVRKIKTKGLKSQFENTAWCRIDAASVKGVLGAMSQDEFETIIMFSNRD
jgi:hypothetical protein